MLNQLTKSNVTKIPYREADHLDWWSEWQFHEGVRDWHYCTAIAKEKGNPDHLFFLQYTLIIALFDGYETQDLHCGVTDITNKRKFANVTPTFIVSEDEGRHVYSTGSDLRINPDPNAITLDLICQAPDDSFGFTSHMRDSQGPSWHCDDGVECMGDPNDPTSRTLYYSWMNLPAEGEIWYPDENGNRVEVEYETSMWFDRQWGPFQYNTNAACWEWFSWRFFDGDRVMIQCFPNTGLNDFTYHSFDGLTHKHFINGWYRPIEYIESVGIPYSIGWNFHIPYKEQNYELRPFMKNHFHGAGVITYFEGPGEIYNEKNELVGYFIGELCPGARMNQFAPKVVDNSPLTMDSNLGQIFDFPGAVDALKQGVTQVAGPETAEKLIVGLYSCYKQCKQINIDGLKTMTNGLFCEQFLQPIFDALNAAAGRK